MEVHGEQKIEEKVFWLVYIETFVTKEGCKSLNP